MQPTELQVQRTLAALRDGPVISTSSCPVAHDAVDQILQQLPSEVFSAIQEAPSVRRDRLDEAVERLARGVWPTPDQLADRMVGRLVCDRLR
ncbi:MAG: hypothetical protein MUF83_19755 [Acidimicrobiales bacterium]|jgi:hypothetical protein|nr:hypothetical protein [Acidimicrobiales bacterium]